MFGEDEIMTLKLKIEEQEHPAARRMREQFEEKYGDLSDVMRSINRWRNTVEDFRRPCNADMESPVTNADMDAAEESMLAEIRRYAGRPGWQRCAHEWDMETESCTKCGADGFST